MSFESPFSSVNLTTEKNTVLPFLPKQTATKLSWLIKFCLVWQANSKTTQFIKTTLFSLLCTSLMLIADPVQQLFTPANMSRFDWHLALAVFGFHFLLCIAGNRILAVAIMALFSVFQFSQLLHISYVGRPLDPTTIGSIFTEAQDVSGAVTGTFREHLHLGIAVVIPYLLLFYLYVRWLPQFTLPTQSSIKPQPRNKRYSAILLIRTCAIVLIFTILAEKPIRALNQDLSHFMPEPENPSLYNSLEGFSFFLVRGFPSIEEAMPRASIPDPIVTPISSDAQTIWLVIVDSLRSDHLQLYGYPRSTTPRLAQWFKNDPSPKTGIASAVATAASIPLMINTVYDPGNLKLLQSEQTNLFKLAKQAGFETHWISSQDSSSFKYLGEQYIDHFWDANNDAELFDREKDGGVISLIKANKLIPETENSTNQKKKFVVVLLRGTHVPYEANYAHKQAQFSKWNDEVTLAREIQGINSYDNSVLYVDSVLDELMAMVSQQPGENHIVITADHGQLLGEDKLWGHNVLKQEVVKVPMLSKSWNAPAESTLANSLQNTPWITHFEMSQWLAKRIGYEISLPQYDINTGFVQGKNLFGINQYLQVKMQTEEKLDLSKPFNTHNYVAKGSQ